jgi:hypothetical protein
VTTAAIAFLVGNLSGFIACLLALAYIALRAATHHETRAMGSDAPGAGPTPSCRTPPFQEEP